MTYNLVSTILRTNPFPVVRSLVHSDYATRNLIRNPMDSNPSKPDPANKATMSQQLVLSLPGATARSKGQARRRNQPALSEDARKAQRNLARRERARYRKTGKTEQQLV